MKIEVKNDAAVKAVLTTVAPRVARNLVRSTVHAVAGEVRDEIRRTAPDDPRTSDDLKRSVRTRRERIRGNYFSSTVRIGKFYWRFLEYGTVKLGARPYVLPAAEKLRARLPQMFREQFGQKLEAALRRATK